MVVTPSVGDGSVRVYHGGVVRSTEAFAGGRSEGRSCSVRRSQGYVKVGMSTLSRPAGRIEGCGVEPFTPFDTRSALLRTLTSVTLTQPYIFIQSCCTQ